MGCDYEVDYIHFTINLASAYEVKHTLNELVSYSPLVIIRQVSDISSKIEMTGKRELIFTYIEVSIERVSDWTAIH